MVILVRICGWTCREAASPHWSARKARELERMRFHATWATADVCCAWRCWNTVLALRSAVTHASAALRVGAPSCKVVWLLMCTSKRQHSVSRDVALSTRRGSSTEACEK